MLWVDKTNQAELATAQVGAMKAGLTVVTIDENDSIEDVSRTLSETEASGIIFSPTTLDSNKEKRANSLYEILPELGSMYPGDEFESARFASLKHVIQTSQKTIRGTTKFKENMLYTKKAQTNYRIPGTSAEHIAVECYKQGEKITQFTQAELAAHSEQIFDNHLAKADKLLPIFVSLSMQYPLALACLLGSAKGQRKLFVPSTYNLNDIAHSFGTQKSDFLVCDNGLYGAQIPDSDLKKVKESTEAIKNIIIGSSDGSSPSESSLFDTSNTNSLNNYFQ